MKENEEIKIDYLDFPNNVRAKSGVYLGSNENFDIPFYEVITNATDEAAAGYGDVICLSTDMNGYLFCADRGRGLPITMSDKEPGITQAELSLNRLHSGSKLFGNNNSNQWGAGTHGRNAV